MKQQFEYMEQHTNTRVRETADAPGQDGHALTAAPVQEPGRSESAWEAAPARNRVVAAVFGTLAAAEFVFGLEWTTDPFFGLVFPLVMAAGFGYIAWGAIFRPGETSFAAPHALPANDSIAGGSLDNSDTDYVRGLYGIPPANHIFGLDGNG